MQLDNIRQRVENYYKVDITNRSRVEEYVNGRVVFTLIALDQGFYSNQIANYLGFNRTLISYYKASYLFNPYFLKQKDLVENFQDVTREIDDVAMQTKFDLIKDMLAKLEVTDMTELRNKMDLMIKSKQWEFDNELKKYEGHSAFLME